MENQFEKGFKNPLSADAGTSYIHRIGNELKTAIFRMVALITKEQEISIYIALAIPFVEFLPIIGFSFYDQTYEIWSFAKVHKGLHTFFEYLRLVQYFKETSMAAYIAIFYLLLIFVAIIIFELAYSYYTASKRRLVPTWPVVMVKFMLIISSNIFFYQFMDYFASILACRTNKSGQSVHSYFSEQVCWEGIHLATGILSIFIIIVFFGISSIATLTLFEARPLKNNLNAIKNARTLMIFNLHKLILTFLFTFITDEKFQIFLLAYLFLGALVVFAKFEFQNPFYHQVVAKGWSTMASLNLWTVAMLIFAKVFDDTKFKESVFLWMFGIPFVIAINLTSEDKKTPYFFINTHQFSRGSEVINHIQYLQKLINQMPNRVSTTLLDGYIELHKINCPDEQCPCKNSSKGFNANRIIYNLSMNNEDLTEKEALLFYLIYQLYMKGLRMFPKYIPLRISFAFFLLDKLSSRRQALQILTEAEQKPLQLDQEFLVFRYKRLIEDQIGEIQDQIGDDLDIDNETSFMSQFRQFQALIEKSSLLHMEFWAQISEDQPDLARISDIGSKISLSIRQVEDHWTKLIRINPNNTNLLRLYGKYFIEVLHNTTKGEQFLSKAANVHRMKDGNTNLKLIATNKDLVDEPTPIIIVSGEQQSLGIINNINVTAASLFGYSRLELLNQRLEVLMPTIYAKHHDSLLEKYVQNNQGASLSSSSKTKDRSVFGRTKTNYIFPFSYNSRAISSALHGTQFIASLQIEKRFKNSAYILTSPEGAIDSISSSCISLLKFDQSSLLKNPDINQFVPNIMIDRYVLFPSKPNGARAPADVSFFYPKDSEYLTQDEGSQIKLTCYLTDIIFVSGRENIGFQFRFEKPKQTLSPQLELPPTTLVNFQFNYSRQKAAYVGEYVTKGTQSEIEEITSPKFSNVNLLSPHGAGKSAVTIPVSNTEIEEISTDIPKRTDYSIGIKTYQIVKGEFYGIDDTKSDENEDESDTENENDQKKAVAFNRGISSVNEDQEEEEEVTDLNSRAKAEKIVTAVVNARDTDTNIKRLNYLIHILGVLMIGFAVWDYANFTTEISGLTAKIANVNQANIMRAEMMTALTNLRELYLLERGLYYSSQEQTFRTNLIQALYSADEIKQTIQAETDSLSAEHQTLFNDPVIPLRRLDGTTDLQGLIQATENIVTLGLNLAQSDLSTITQSNSDYYFIVYNLFHAYNDALFQSTELYVTEFINQSNSNQVLAALLLFIISTVLALIIIVPLMYAVRRSQDEILRLFLDISDKTIKNLQVKCENFLSNLQIGEEDIESELGDDEVHPDHEEQGFFVSRRKRKRFKDSRRFLRKFLFCFTVLALAMHVPVVFSYVIGAKSIKDLGQVAVEYNLTSFAEAYFNYAKNFQSQLYIDTGSVVPPILDITTAYNITVQNNHFLITLKANLLSNNSVNTDSHTDTYNQIFHQMFFDNPCSFLTEYISTANCELFANKTAAKGMDILLVRHVENFDSLLSSYVTLKAGGNWPFAVSLIRPNVDSNPIVNKILSFVFTPRGLELGKIPKWEMILNPHHIDPTQDIFIKNCFRIVNQDFQTSVKTNFEDTKTIKLLALIALILALFAAYILIWIPYITLLNNMVWKTKSMLLMIPVSVIINVKSIKDYLRNATENNSLY